MIFAAQSGLVFPSKLFGESYALEISMQNCDYAKKVEKTVIEKKNSLRILGYYEAIGFRGPAFSEIVFDAYDVDQAKDEFANKWYYNCLDFSSSDFWIGMDAILIFVSND